MDLVERAGRLCAREDTDRSLRAELLAEIRRRIVFDAHVFAMTDPVSRVVSSPHATLPMVPADELGTLIGTRYACPDRREWAAWLAHRYGVADVAFVELHDRYGSWGFLELWRTKSSFSRAERDSLSALAPVVAAGLRRTVVRTFAPAPEPGSVEGGGLPPVEPGVILLDAHLRVRSETGPAAEALLRLLPPDAEVPPVPAVAFNVGGKLLASGPNGSAGAWTRVHLGDGRWMTARADPLDEGIAVSISPCTPTERVDLYARAHRLSPRETEVLGLALSGLDSRSVASALTISPSTAEDHLRALLAKTGARSRQHLVVTALGGRLSLPG